MLRRFKPWKEGRRRAARTASGRARIGESGHRARGQARAAATRRGVHEVPKRVDGQRIRFATCGAGRSYRRQGPSARNLHGVQNPTDGPDAGAETEPPGGRAGGTRAPARSAKTSGMRHREGEREACRSAETENFSSPKDTVKRVRRKVAGRGDAPGKAPPRVRSTAGRFATRREEGEPLDFDMSGRFEQTLRRR